MTAEFAIGGSPQWGVEAWAGEEAVYVRSTTPWLVRIDPATNEIVETITSEQAVQGPLTVAFDSIWTVNLEHPDVFRLNPSPGPQSARPRSRPSRRGRPGAPVPTRTPP